jgi:solute carrier family 25 S-adenosylmethionine transporter 26
MPPASLFFTTYELSKSTLPRLVPHLAREDFAPLLHMASASTGEVVRGGLFPLFPQEPG